MPGGRAHLKAILARIPTAGNVQIEAFNRYECGFAKSEGFKVEGG